MNLALIGGAACLVSFAHLLFAMPSGWVLVCWMGPDGWRVVDPTLCLLLLAPGEGEGLLLLSDCDGGWTGLPAGSCKGLSLAGWTVLQVPY